MDGNTALATRSEKEIIADLQRSRQPTRHVSAQANSCASRQGNEKANGQLKNVLEDDNVAQENAELTSEDGSGSESEVDPIPKERKNTNRAHRTNAQFENFLEQHQLDLQVRAAAIGQKHDEQQSTKWLVKNIEVKDIISSPRDYQVELFERAKKENVIAVLDTGKYLCLSLFDHIS